jgi:hypothetical protein
VFIAIRPPIRLSADAQRSVLIGRGRANLRTTCGCVALHVRHIRNVRDMSSVTTKRPSYTNQHVVALLSVSITHWIRPCASILICGSNTKGSAISRVLRRVVRALWLCAQIFPLRCLSIHHTSPTKFHSFTVLSRLQIAPLRSN